MPESDTILRDGDPTFTGVDMRLSPGALPPGRVAYARNKRFTDGSVATRKGTPILSYTSRGSEDETLVWPMGPAFGAITFRDPGSNDEWIIVAAGGTVWKMYEGGAATPLRLPTGVLITEPVSFFQGINVLIMHRGRDLAPFQMVSMNEGFKPIPDPVEPSLDALPWAASGILFQNRHMVPAGDEVSYSDVLQFAKYQPATESLTIAYGDGDELMGVAKFNDQTVVAFKTKSVHAIANLTPDDEGNFSAAIVDEITSDYGCVGHKAVVRVGADLWFLAPQRGIASIRQTESNKLQGVDIPVSRDIEPLIREIDWEFADRTRAAFWDNKVLFAVPTTSGRSWGANLAATGTWGAAVDTILTTVGAEYLWSKGANETALTNGTETLLESGFFRARENATRVAGVVGQARSYALARAYRGQCDRVLVFDTVTQSWAGFDHGQAPIVEWLTATFQGQSRLHYLDSEGYLHLYEDGCYDHIGDPETGAIDYMPVEDAVTSRGYFGGRPGAKRGTRLLAAWAHWDPGFFLSEMSDNLNDARTVATVTRDRTRYTAPFSAEPYDPTNADDNHAAPNREDYSVLVPAAGILWGSGMDFGLQVEDQRRFRLSSAGAYIQIRQEGYEGRCTLRSLEVSAVPWRQALGGIR